MGEPGEDAGKPGADPATCLTEEEARAAAAIYDGPRTAAGERLTAGGLLPGSEANWRGTVAPDDAGDPDKAVTAVKELIGEGVNIIAGTASSGVALAVAEQAQQNKVLYISGPAAADAITGINDYTFRSGRQSAQDVATAGTFLEDLEGKTVAVFAQDNAFGQGNVAAVDAILGGAGATVTPVLVAEDVTEFTPFAQQVLAGAPDLVFVAWAGATSGAMWQAMSQQGVLDETYIVFSSDNGYSLGEHRFVGKDVLTDEALQVPLLVRGPDVVAGATSQLPVTLVDLPVTFAALTGVTPQWQVDGTSLAPTLRGDDQPFRDTTLIQTGRTLGDGWSHRGVRTERYLYGTDGLDTFLYDRLLDPDEMVNLVDDPAYATVRATLESRRRELVDCAGWTCNQQFGPVPEPVTSSAARE